MNDSIDLARELLAAAATIATTDDPPAPDWSDDRDVGIVFIMQFAAGLATLLQSRDDLADGLISGRYIIRTDHTGITLLEGDLTPTV